MTDDIPGGNDQVQSNVDATLFNALTLQCNAAGIKVIVIGGGASDSLYSSLASNTGGTTNTSVNASNITSSITNACNTPAP